METKGSVYPVVFQFRAPVIGKGYVAGVEIAAAMVVKWEEVDQEMWGYGVCPGAVAGRGRSIGEVHREVHLHIREVLTEIAHEARDFTEFKAAAEEFICTCDEETLEVFERAKHDVTAGKLDDAELPRKSGYERQFKVVELTGKLSPKDNVGVKDEEVVLAADGDAPDPARRRSAA
ncbi:MAG: hypothetical protein DWQ36_19665 [Acidobacteria bacterium]|nr:MAG: hypothetical protein DWQ30_05975 [Acidobacteriota bacterium]REK03758.1 MAG: hypothetical protein DWQ36_19665 [Acidobacteriota bacterium]